MISFVGFFLLCVFIVLQNAKCCCQSHSKKQQQQQQQQKTVEDHFRLCDSSSTKRRASSLLPRSSRKTTGTQIAKSGRWRNKTRLLTLRANSPAATEKGKEMIDIEIEVLRRAKVGFCFFFACASRQNMTHNKTQTYIVSWKILYLGKYCFFLKKNYKQYFDFFKTIFFLSLLILFSFWNIFIFLKKKQKPAFFNHFFAWNLWNSNWNLFGLGFGSWRRTFWSNCWNEFVQWSKLELFFLELFMIWFLFFSFDCFDFNFDLWTKFFVFFF